MFHPVVFMVIVVVSLGPMILFYEYRKKGIMKRALMNR